MCVCVCVCVRVCVQPYPSQALFMKSVWDVLEHGGLGIFESPTGTVSACFKCLLQVPASSACYLPCSVLPHPTPTPHTHAPSDCLVPGRLVSGILGLSCYAAPLLPCACCCSCMCPQGKSMSLICGALAWLKAHEARTAETPTLDYDASKAGRS